MIIKWGKKRFKFQWKDKWGYPFVGYINNPLKTGIRFIFQFIRGNLILTMLELPNEKN